MNEADLMNRRPSAIIDAVGDEVDRGGDMQAHDDAASPRAGALDLAIVSGWPVALFVGIVTIALGVIVLAWPEETLKVLSVLLGLQLLLFGLFRLIGAFSSSSESPGVVGFIGVIGMLAGVVVLRHPFETVSVLATILGVVWIVGGSIDLIAAVADRSLVDPGLTALSGLVSLAAGVVVVAWPAPTLAVLAVVCGLYLVIIGLVISATAVKVRALEQ